MTHDLSLAGGVRLHCVPDQRFVQNCLSLQFVRPMNRQEAPKNALLPAVLLRGCKQYPDLRAITLALDDLYGATVQPLTRRIGDYQTCGLYCAFVQDRFAQKGDEIFRPMMDLLRGLLREPLVENSGFSRDFVENEKGNLLSAMAAEGNDKRVYAQTELLRRMARGDSFGIPRWGDKEAVKAVTAENLYDHYRLLLEKAPLEITYVGALKPETVAKALEPLFSGLNRQPEPLPPQTDFYDLGGGDYRETQDVAQARLHLGFVTPLTNRTPGYAAMQLLNTVYGGGLFCKLFRVIREELSLCYSIDSAYFGAKGLLLVSAGIDSGSETLAREEILRQLDLCRAGEITQEELDSAKQEVLSALRSIGESSGTLEAYHATFPLSAMTLSLDAYRQAIEALTVTDLEAAARSLRLHSTFFLGRAAE